MRLFESRYSKRWQGVVLEESSCCYLMLLILDRNGKPVKRRIVDWYRKGYMADTAIDYDMSTVNPDWLKGETP